MHGEVYIENQVSATQVFEHQGFNLHFWRCLLVLVCYCRMNRRKAVKLLLLGGASASTLISYKWVERIRKADVAYVIDKQKLIAELAETIIPETETPGAKAAQTEVFILRMLQDCTDKRSLSNFIVGLEEVEEDSFARYKRSFIDCTEPEKKSILQKFEASATFFSGRWAKAEAKLLGQPFFSLLKDYTVLGYCTSRVGATQALNYDMVPGGYEKVVLVGNPQKSWATK